jgi:uncharacterized protein YbjT (DUF2867 family)
MYVVSGATGRVGSVVAQTLLDAGAEVRVLVRRASDADAWTARGADARAVALGDRGALAAALDGAAGAFVLLPFDLTVPDLDAHADLLVTSIAGAVADSRVPHVVALSSGGADLPGGTGPIVGLHRLEEALRHTDAVVTALRSGHFQEKVGDVLPAAEGEGVFPVFASSADVPLPMVATRDLGAVAANALLAPSASSEAVDVVGPAYTERAVAAVLGRALGRELEVVTVPAEAWVASLRDAGFGAHVAESLAELYRADEAGMLAPRGDRSVTVSTPIDDTIARMLAARS